MIGGQLDTTVACDDGSLAILDFKTSEPNADHVGVYGRQLHAYALAVKRPSSARSRVVSGLGLVCFLPNWFRTESTGAMLCGEVKYVRVELNRDGFERFLTDVGRLLDQPVPPRSSPTCVWCKWLLQPLDVRNTASIADGSTYRGGS